jgi:predicted TPR repeat methyltransferase
LEQVHKLDLHKDNHYIILPLRQFRQFDLIIYYTFPDYIFMTKTFSSTDPTPQELENLFNHACRLHEIDKPKEALAAYRQLLTILPDSPLLHFNCGLALFELEQFPEAEQHYQRAAEINHKDPDIHHNRGLNFRRLNNFKDAAKSFELAFKLGDTSVDTIYNLALCFQDMQDYSEAGRLYDIILEGNPEHLSSLNNYAYLCHKSGATDKAEQLYHQLLKLNPQHQAAKHMVNSLSGKTPDTAPLDYVEAIFDNYAKDFEHSLVEQLQYETPYALRKLYGKLFPDDSRDICLDLGCGTGLAGVQFRTCCKELIGVDISEEMLRVAGEKNLYKKLVKDDILHFLQKSGHNYDMIVAADVFTYMGDLEKIFLECSAITKNGALFLFSVEESNSDKYELKTTGRFGHSAKYIKKLCQKTGWRILDAPLSNLRQDRGEWIKGHLFILQK